MSKLKRAAEAVRAPRDRAEAEEMLAQLGAVQRDLALAEAALAETVAGAKAAAEAAARPLQAQQEALLRGLQLWAEANRHALTEGGRTKTVKLATGEIAWRARPPKVVLRDLTAVQEALVSLGLQRFLRTKVEVNKEAMLAEPAVARQVPGVSIGSEGEEFVAAPVAAALAGAA